MFGVQSVPQNCGRIIEQIGAAARHGVDVVVFPETATSSYQVERALENRADIEAGVGRIREAVRKTAGPWVVLGTFTYPTGSEGAHNSSLLLDPDGHVRGEYHKINQGGRRWLLAEIKGVRCTLLICSDFWVPGILYIPKMLGAQVCFYSHASCGVSRDRPDWSALYYTRAWESKLFLVMADNSWFEGEPFERPANVPYPYDFTHHLLNQSCILDPEPRYLARATRDEQDGLLIADLDPSRTKEPLDAGRFTVGAPWKEMLKFYEEHGHIERIA